MKKVSAEKLLRGHSAPSGTMIPRVTPRIFLKFSSFQVLILKRYENSKNL